MDVADAADPRVRSGRTRSKRTRSALLAAAGRAFADRGWLGARIEDIARDAGVSAATAFNHFSTKHCLIGHVYGPLTRPALEAAAVELADGRPILEVLERHVRELAQLTRRHQSLTVAFVGAAEEYAARVGGPPSPGDANDPRVLAPMPDVLVRAIAAGQENEVLRPYPPALDIGRNVINLLLVRTMTTPRESAEDTAELMLTVLFGTLHPQTLVDAGLRGRPFARSR